MPKPAANAARTRGATPNRRPISRRPPPAESSANGAAFPATPGPPLADLDFDDDAYRRYPMTAAQQRDTDRRLEFWDGDTETAMEVRDGVTLYHEWPSHRLAQLVERIAQVRGKPIACYGTMDLVFPAKGKRKKRVLQPDQSLFLRPERANLVRYSTMVVGETDYPDVVMEVDYSTDVRRNKLKLYEAWGFPEVWVSVPAQSPWRKPHGVTIHLRGDSCLSPAPESRAFPGWRAAEIHAALHEERLSEGTVQVLERVGRILGERDGTGPDDDPLMRSLRQQAQADAHADATAAELQRRAAFVRRQLASRGVAVTANFPLEQPGFAEADVEALADIALRCTSQADFAARLKQARDDAEPG